MNAEANILLFPYLQLYLLSTGSDKGVPCVNKMEEPAEAVELRTP